jgi:hypothetical protein
MLVREFRVLFAYNQARSSGDKHSAAVREAVQEIRRCFPGMPISETEAKRIVAKMQPQDFPVAFQAGRIRDADLKQQVARLRTLKFPGAETIKVGFDFGIGPRPTYLRHNAKLKKATVSEGTHSDTRPLSSPKKSVLEPRK